ncbi:glycoside hydrolase family 3 C-terminal domain-containing protein [Rhodanobacter lindaniclasticus]|uniref:glycoside hydrolase family 3 C-terminal domain-containing protein n=1 Tax=Rhodanobacter lindaniclasticus TaxID=75310 RepID=UPI0026A36B4D
MQTIQRASGPVTVCATIAMLLAAACPGHATDATRAADATPAWRDTSLDFDRRAADLVSRMTLEEKIAQMQNAATAIPRLGVPAYDWWNEALHGVARAGTATVFPQAIGLAATFDVPLMHRVATAISDEARAKHDAFVREGKRERYQGLTFWSPNINIFRDPRWGRGQETYGEDPYLTARMGVAFVDGLQGDDPTYRKLDATAKHFAVHSGPESERHHFDARPSERDLYETYLPAFQALVQEAHVDAVMSAYNRVDGAPATGSKRLLGDILRSGWGFKGYVVSDCGAVADIFQHHKLVGTAEQAAALAVSGGVDLNCGTTYASLAKAVHDGLVDASVIDTAVQRLMLARFRLGMFDPSAKLPWSHLPELSAQLPAHGALARTAARESMVLLKNDGLLPLPRTLKRVAVVGPTADSVAALLGNYHGTPLGPVTVLAGIREALPRARVEYVQGADLVEGVKQPIDSGQFEAALDAAHRAEVVIFVGGLTADIEGEEMPVHAPGFDGGDRTSLRLPAPQLKLLKALQATGKPVVLVLTTGSALAVNWAAQKLPAILLAWYPGQAGGHAVADVLFGDADPAGRLPVTFYTGVQQLPPFDDYAMKGRTYRYFDGHPLFPFGYGLSYTHFDYADLHLDRTALDAGESMRITLTVKNTGQRAGDEVVQLYLRALDAPHAHAIKSLRGVRRISLNPGEQRVVSFDITPQADLRYYDAAQHAYAVDPGRYQVQVGASSADIRVAGDFSVRR